MAFVERLLRFTFRLSEGTFGGSGFNTVTLEGLRAQVQLNTNVSTPNTPGAVLAIAVIFGMDLTQVNALTKAGIVYQVKPGTPLNQVTIEAGDTNTGYQVVFSGVIVEASPKFNRMPQTAFVVTANSLHEM
jgi:hypothetical protein